MSVWTPQPTRYDERSLETMSDETPFRYTAAMAQDIELAWQDVWEDTGAFNAPNLSLIHISEATRPY